MQGLSCLAVLLLAAGSLSVAQPLVPSPSVPSIAESDGWAFGIGAGAEYESEYDGSDEYGLEAEPLFAVQYRKNDHIVFLEGAELGWRTRLPEQWLLQAGLRLEGGREEDEAPGLNGLGDTDDELAGVLEVRRGFGERWSNWVAGRVMAGGSDMGALFVAAFGHTFGGQRAGSGIDLLAFTTFGTSQFINRDFGVTPEQSLASGLPVTDLDGGYRSVGVSAIGRWFLGESWQLQLEAGYERYSSDIADSPITLEDYEAEVGVGFLWIF
jgi:outer membrane scaffolding protein for murein synthesis (MipA/OmpV family)